AEDGIRDFHVTGVQTCALPIFHVNGWFGDYDKLTMTRTLFERELGLDIDQALPECLFIGDSPNDEPMFRFFPVSVGVANIQALQIGRASCRERVGGSVVLRT